MSFKYSIKDHQRPHFITFATVQWVDALSRPIYKDVIIESLRFCQVNKGLILHAFVIMNNHVHLIASAKEEYNLSDILRDLKKHTSKTLLEMIENDDHTESRRNWMLWLFESAGKKNSNNKKYQFWQQDNLPIELSTNKMMDQRLEYLHNNPVVERIVNEAEHYIYSSAINYARGKGLLDVEFLE
ncbi:MAG: transposase [Cyclobacteriaceae bacterium]